MEIDDDQIKIRGDAHDSAHRPSLLTSVLRLRCPHCRKGNLFTGSAFSLGRMLEMPGECRACGQDFKIEPGFYIGALWTSFPLVIPVMAVVSVVLLGYFKMQLEWCLLTLSAVLLILQPPIMRLGRSIWIHIFVHYENIQNNTTGSGR